MTLDGRKEAFSRAYVEAVAAVAGYGAYRPTVDDDSVDLDIAARGGGGLGPYRITLSAPPPARECMSLAFLGANVALRLDYQSLPGDVNMNGASTGRDVVDLIVQINAGAAIAALPRYDINRDGVPTAQDVVRLIQLLNGGANVTPAEGFNGATVAPCP